MAPAPGTCGVAKSRCLEMCDMRREEDADAVIYKKGYQHKGIPHASRRY